MSEQETVIFTLELDVQQTMDNVRRLETLFYRSLRLARRFGLPEDINKQIWMIQRLTMTIRLAHTAYIAFQAATGPIGWALAIIGGITAAISAADFMMDYGE